MSTYHIFYGTLDGAEVSAHVHDLNGFLCADPDTQINVSEDGAQYLVHKGAVDWYRVESVDRGPRYDETAHYR